MTTATDVTAATLEQVRDLAARLTFQDKLTLIEELARQLGGKPTIPPPKKPRRSLWGALSGLHPIPTAEEIDEARREAWANFPREEFYERSWPSRTLTH